MTLAVKQVDSSFIAGQIYAYGMALLHAQHAEALVRSGDLDGAEEALEAGFRIDPSLPFLWVARARLQHEQGLHQLADASANYALTIWQGADPDLQELADLKVLQAEIGEALP